LSKRTRWELIILVCMYLGYTSFMVCRNTAIVASPEMIADPSINLDEASYGRLMAYHSAGGVLGKLTTGFAVDRWGGRAIFLLMLGLTAAAAASFAVVSRFGALAAFNLLGQAAKSGGWPAMAAIIRDWYPPEKHGRVWGIISTSSRVGVMTATLFLGHLLSMGIAWRSLFWVSASMGFTMLILGFFFLRSGPSDVGLEPVIAESPEQPTGQHRLQGRTYSQALPVFAASPRVWLICGAMVFTTMIMDFLNFVPLYLSQSLKLESGAAGKATTAFPFGMFVAVLAAGFLYDKLSKKQRIPAIGGLLGSGLLSLVVLKALPSWGALSTQQAYWVSLLAIFWLGVAVAPAYYLPMSVFAISYGGPFCGFLICLFDMFGYAGAFAFNYFSGKMIQEQGWNTFLLFLGGVTLVATAIVSTFLYLDHRAAAGLKTRV
jgi:sugar phosphate permease